MIMLEPLTSGVKRGINKVGSGKKITIAIVTGCNGFMGKALISFLRDKRKDYRILGIDIHLAASSDVDVYVRNTRKKSLDPLIRKELRKSEKIYCFHLAGLIFEKDITKLFSNNLDLSHKIFSMLLPYKEKTTVLNIGSSAEYGYQGERSIMEGGRARPVSNYGFCKLFQTQLARRYYKAYKLPVIMTRTFNVVGPGQTDKLACGSLVKQAVRCKLGLANEIIAKGLNSYRDLLDIRDAVRAYVLLAEKGAPGELYNVASGAAVRMKEVLNTILTTAGISPQIVKNNTNVSKESVPYQKASIKKLKKEITWKPVYSLRRSIKDMISFEISEIK